MLYLLLILGIIMMIASIMYMAIVAISKKPSYEFHEVIFTPMGTFGIIITFVSAYFIGQ